MKKIQLDSTGIPGYPKIETLFERDERFVVDSAKLKLPVLGTIDQWDVTEKIDGTNIRVMISAGGVVSLGGRGGRSQLPPDLIAILTEQFPAEKMTASLWRDGPADVVLFGEGYGAGIQKGGTYRPDKAFILFDVLVGGEYWLGNEAVTEIASKLEVDAVPSLGRMTIGDIVELVREPFSSRIGTAPAEGVVARPIDTLFDRRGKRLIIKLKTKDFGFKR